MHANGRRRDKALEQWDRLFRDPPPPRSCRCGCTQVDAYGRCVDCTGRSWGQAMRRHKSNHRPTDAPRPKPKPKVEVEIPQAKRGRSPGKLPRMAMEAAIRQHLSTAATAKVFNVSPRTIRRWRRGRLLAGIEPLDPPASGRIDYSEIQRAWPHLYGHVLRMMTRRQLQYHRLYFIEALTTPKIADVEGVSASAVAQGVKRIRALFRKWGLPEPKHAREGRRKLRDKQQSTFSQHTLKPGALPAGKAAWLRRAVRGGDAR